LVLQWSMRTRQSDERQDVIDRLESG